MTSRRLLLSEWISSVGPAPHQHALAMMLSPRRLRSLQSLVHIYPAHCVCSTVLELTPRPLKCWTSTSGRFSSLTAFFESVCCVNVEYNMDVSIGSSKKTAILSSHNAKFSLVSKMNRRFISSCAEPPAAFGTTACSDCFAWKAQLM